MVVLLALSHADGLWFGACLVGAFVSDIFDGVLARRLGVATPGLRRLDSVADSIFYCAALFAAWHLHPQAIRAHGSALLVLAGLEATRYAVDWAKFRREASYHMWSSKAWGVALFAGFFAVLVFGHGGWPVTLAIGSGIVADVEGLAISALLPKWRSDVPTVFHALRIIRSSGA